ncbi:MAG: NAD-dependent epimerase/dehydratase family protein [Candidatus Roizmanbacteria bacterium]|nr:NAD-dependent epimerase/dehydratase family protein [Candidatus Roizmanbacteria bacterium]
MSTYIITGAAGFIGSNLCHELSNQGHTLWAIDNLLTGNRDNLADLLDSSRFHFIQADICDPKTFNALPKNVDGIFHLASPASPVQYANYPMETLMVNSQGTKHVLVFAEETDVKRVVFTSTSEVYGDPLEHPQKETYWGNVNSFGPRSCYDEAKRFAEALCYTFIHKHGIDVKIARLFNTYGPNMERNDGRVISNFIVQSLAKIPITIHGDGQQTRSFCFVTDTVNALIAIMETTSTELIFNIGNPNEQSIRDIALLVQKMTNTTSTIVHKPAVEDDPRRRKPDITRARHELSWQPTITIAKGLEKTILYFTQKFYTR